MLHDRPHSVDPSVNMPSAKRKTRLAPMRSPTHPDAGIQTARLRRYPVTTHSRPVSVEPNFLPIVGNATLTMVTSSTSMNTPTTNVTATILLYGHEETVGMPADPTA